MKGLYKTQDGSKVEVLDFDEANKIVRTSSGWVGEPEYSTWVKEGEQEATDVGSEEIADGVQKEVVAPTIEVYEEPVVEEISTPAEEKLAHEIEKDFEK